MFIIWEILNHLRGRKGSSRPNKPPFNKNEKKLYGISQLIFVVFVIYSFFLPLKLGSVWFYIGFFVYLIGIILTIVAGTNLDNTPMNRSATEGLYRHMNTIYEGTIPSSASLLRQNSATVLTL